MKNYPKKYVFIGKTLFFPKEKILVIGDLHMGTYDYKDPSEKKSIQITFEMVKQEIEKSIKVIKNNYGKIEKIVFLGDIFHKLNKTQLKKEELKKLISFLRKYVDESKIWFIRGNHDLEENNGKYVDYYVTKDIAFIHGNKDYPQIYKKEINLVVMGHLHPNITLNNQSKVNNPKYKCFLVGRYNKKDFVVLPSLLDVVGGFVINEFDDKRASGYDICVIPTKELDNFEVFRVSEIYDEALAVGKLKEMKYI
jgi:putative SbcD/Mre11-related phosphoesterase